MKLKGEIIKKYRIKKGFTQNELADKTKLTSRTIQRLENNQTTARVYTINKIAEVLDLPTHSFQTTNKSRPLLSKVFEFISYIIINFAIVFIFGFLVIDVNANINSFTGAILLSVLIPVVIYNFTKSMTTNERMIKFGCGLCLYLLVFFILHDIAIFTKGIIYVVLIYSLVLYYSTRIRINF